MTNDDIKKALIIYANIFEPDLKNDLIEDTDGRFDSSEVYHHSFGTLLDEQKVNKLDTINAMISKLRREIGSAGSPREKRLLRNMLADRKQLLKTKKE